MTPAELRALVARLDNLDRRGGLGYDAHDLLRETVNALPALLDQLAAAERDAARYRWLRPQIPGSEYRNIGIEYGEPAQIDAAIDAARAKVKP